ncbi:unnamed protein product, partial [Hymenolepis diminuta]
RFSVFSGDHFKRLLFLCVLRDLCVTDVCRLILKMIEESDKIALEYLVNESLSLNISVIIQQLSVEYSYMN